MTARIIVVSLFVIASALAGCEVVQEDQGDIRPEPATAQVQQPPPTQPRPAQVQKQPARPQPRPTPAPPSAPSAPVDPRLLDPAAANEQAPARYTVKLTTSEGPIHIEVTRAWAPRGADRFYNLVKVGFLNDVAFFRVIEGFMAQVGLHGDARVNSAWRSARIQDDPVTQSNTPGMVSFATSGANSRTTQFFINFGNNSNLDPMGFSPFARVRPADMAVVNRIHNGYGEGAPRGRGPSQGLIQSQGNTYLRAQFPDLDYIESAEIL